MCFLRSNYHWLICDFDFRVTTDIFFCLITGFLPFNSQYLNCWKCGQQCDEMEVIIIVNGWHICYLLGFSDNWRIFEQWINRQNQKLGWVKKGSTFFLSCFKIEHLHGKKCVLQLVHWTQWWRVFSLVVSFGVFWVLFWGWFFFQLRTTFSTIKKNQPEK